MKSLVKSHEIILEMKRDAVKLRPSQDIPKEILLEYEQVCGEMQIWQQPVKLK